MPLPTIKSLKSIGRRKSAGNSIEESAAARPTSGSTFRVIPRDDTNRKVAGGHIQTDGRSSTSRDYTSSRQNSEEDSASSNRGSGSTGTSGHSRNYDSTPGPRYASPSNLQSHTEAVRKDPQFSLSPLAPSLLSISTEIDTSGDFGDMFSGFNKRKSQLLMDDNHMLSRPPAPAVLRTESEPLFASPTSSRPAFLNRLSKTPPPLTFGKGGGDTPEKSPYTWNSRTSNDGLLSSPPPDSSPFLREPTLGSKNSNSAGERDDFMPLPPTPLGPHTLQRSMSNESFIPSGANGDADAQMVSDSVRAVRANTIRTSTYQASPLGKVQLLKQEAMYQDSPSRASASSSSSLQTPSMSSSASSFNANDRAASNVPNRTASPASIGMNAVGPSSTNTTPRAKAAQLAEFDEEPLFDPSMANAIRTAGMREAQFAKALPPTPQDLGPKKRYTLTQFEILKKHANAPMESTSEESDSEDNYDDDEDDEATVLQKRRAQQQKEAQHLVWRQRMTKDIGDQSSPLPGRPSFQRINQSAPNLSFGHAAKNSVSDTAKSGESSDDEDVPLGVLQAHGFPKNNQPVDSRLSANSYVGRPISTIGPLPPRSSSPARSTAGGNRHSVLPPFARRLPQDPYQNDLVNPANRESMGFNNRASVTQSVYGAPSPQVPGGLVGVIAEEERQRGMRRGSPNTQARQSVVGPPGMPMMPMMPGMMPGMPPGMMPMMPGVGMEQQQLNQQMFQLMQQQATMIEQMSLQMAQLGATPNMPPNGFLQPQGAPGRPISMASSNARPGYAQSRTMSMINLQPPMTQRTMSMVSLPGQGWPQDSFMSGAASVRGFGNGYAPSVAPSERSNIGQPSRYKPVQTSQMGDGMSTITGASTVKPTITPVAEKKRSKFFSAIIHPPHKGKGKQIASDDEDEDDWSSFAKKRKNKRG